jgi:hypothetical protein
MKVHLVDFNRIQIYEAGAMLVTLLAYPGASGSDEERRGQLHASLCARMLRASYEVDPDLATLPQTMKPIYRLQTERDCRKSLRSLPRLLRDRMVAARMAYPFLTEAESGKTPALPVGLKRFSLNQMAELVLSDAGQADAENVETRIWRPSRPVIHLATVVHGYLHLVGLAAEVLGALLMTSRPVIEYLIRNAEYCETLVAKSSRLRIDADRLIKIRLAQAG